MRVGHFLAMVIYREHNEHTDKSRDGEDAYAAHIYTQAAEELLSARRNQAKCVKIYDDEIKKNW
jgi:hypothetical protein